MKTVVSLIVAGWLLGAASLDAGPIPTAPIYTNKLRFRIPYHYDPAELKRLGAGRIRLYVSRDLGRNWQQSQEVNPDSGKFTFQANSDGEYWFIVRSVDARGHEHPDATDTTPGLQVIVDTTPPTLQLNLRQSTAGKVQLTWTASDVHLDASQLRLEYIQPGISDWEPVSVVPKPDGQSEWLLPQGGLVAVRGSVNDLARNRAQAEAQVQVSPASQTVPKPRSPGHRQPVAGPGRAPAGDPALSMSDQFPDSRSAVDRLPFAAIPPKVGQGPVLDPLQTPPGRPRDSLVSQHSDEFPAAPVIMGGLPPAPPVEAAHEPVSNNRRFVNSLRFQIGYKLHEFDPASITAVELYITQDKGTTWYRYPGGDDDRQSPAHVEVPKDGIYGFALGVRTTDGQSTEVPQQGDPPAMEVVVDRTPPRIELLRPRKGRGKDANKVLIEWTYADEYPAEQPVTVYYAADAEGPWQKISDVTEKTGDQMGRYIWTVEPGTPAKFLLRIEAKDHAGNVQTAETPRPVVFNATPTARIIDVQKSQQPAPQ